MGPLTPHPVSFLFPWLRRSSGVHAPVPQPQLVLGHGDKICVFLFAFVVPILVSRVLRPLLLRLPAIATAWAQGEGHSLRHPSPAWCWWWWGKPSWCAGPPSTSSSRLDAGGHRPPRPAVVARCTCASRLATPTAASTPCSTPSCENQALLRSSAAAAAGAQQLQRRPRSHGPRAGHRLPVRRPRRRRSRLTRAGRPSRALRRDPRRLAGPEWGGGHGCGQGGFTVGWIAGLGRAGSGLDGGRASRPSSRSKALGWGRGAR